MRLYQIIKGKELFTVHLYPLGAGYCVDKLEAMSMKQWFPFQRTLNFEFEKYVGLQELHTTDKLVIKNSKYTNWTVKQILENYELRINNV